MANDLLFIYQIIVFWYTLYDNDSTWKNGDVYEGEFLNKKMHGKGKLSYINGDKYDGE